MSSAVEEFVNSTVLLLQVPRTNEKKELAAEQLLASLHGLLYQKGSGLLSRGIRRHISLEIAVQHRQIGFYVWVPTDLKGYVEEQIYAQYPSVQISQVADYTVSEQEFSTNLTTELKYSANEALPIKTFPSFEVDPLAAITASLSQFEENEEVWMQIIIRPAPSGWHKKSERYISNLKGRTATSGMGLSVLWAPPGDKAPGGAPSVSEHDSARAKAAEEKAQKLVYETVVRIVYNGNQSEAAAAMRLQAITSSFKQFHATYLNGFESRVTSAEHRFVEAYRQRAFPAKSFVANIEEVASLYHLPHTNVETPSIRWASTKTAEPPSNLPIVFGDSQDLSPIAVTNFRGTNTMFGLPRFDRSRHVYILGQTGTGKSGMLELLTISDMYSASGFAVIDPHGDFAVHTLQRMPANRLEDIVYFNPADRDFPIGFNPLEVTDPAFKNHISSELVGVLKRMFENSWGPRLEYVLRYSILALLDYPEATMLDIVRMLTEKKFRSEVVSHVTDSVVKNFWTVEFASWNDKFAAEAVAPILNKVGAFTANPIIRNVIGQPKSSFNIRQMMDDGKIFVVNLSKGLLGEDNAAILGALLVTKIQLSAMSRADIADVEDRKPFYLYVDEFQNFATDSFATILSEARKYGLNLTVANQYTSQMIDTVKDAVFGNVGTIIALRMGAEDAKSMVKYFEPVFTDQDLIHMSNRHFVISMSINGEKSQAFSGYELVLPELNEGHVESVVQRSRALYAKDRQAVEDYIHGRYMTSDAKIVTAAKPPTLKAQVQMQQTEKHAPAHVPLGGVIEAPLEPYVPAAAPAADAEEPTAPKKKRTRRGKRKKKDTNEEPRSSSPQPRVMSDERPRQNQEPKLETAPKITVPDPPKEIEKSKQKAKKDDDETVLRLR